MESETLPSQRVLKTCYDTAGRVSSLNGTSISGTQTPYATGIGYAPHGAISQLSRGDTLTETWNYNNRLQPIGISVGSVASPRSVFGLDLYYCPNQTATCATNNGNLQSQKLPILNAQQTFTYDTINRLQTAGETSSNPSWSQTYGYDHFGNRWVSIGSINSFTPIASTNFDASNRLQIQGTSYDASGDEKQIGGYSFVWDSEERQHSSSINSATTTYAYDDNGRRVMKQGSDTTVYVYNAFGDLAAEYSSTPQSNPPCATCYLTRDHLGSTRALTNSGGSVVALHDYLPFGEEVPTTYGGRNLIAGYTSTDDINQKFTGKERDSESGLDYFGARYYGSALGRFTSTDGGGPHPSAPQSWNRYVYANNNPMVTLDPDGNEPVKSQASTIQNFVRVFSQNGSAGGLSGQAAADALYKIGGFPPSTGSLNDSASRYIYTKGYGWVDMLHFVYYASNAYGFRISGFSKEEAENATVLEGKFQEGAVDKVLSPESAYSYEDLPSDALAAIFGAAVFDPQSKLTLGQQIEKFLLSVGATTPKNAPNYNDLPDSAAVNTAPLVRNHSTRPMFTTTSDEADRLCALGNPAACGN